MVEKNAKKEKAKSLRVTFDMNTGERIHKDDRFPSRQEKKKHMRDEIESYDDGFDR